jgi:hypothetical protein
MISCRMILAGLVSVSAAALAQTAGAVIGLMRDSVTNGPIPAEMCD